MDDAIKSGISFGLTEAIITTLGLIFGLSAGTNSKLAVIGGILTIAIADAFSDAFGIHIFQESKNASKKEVWQASLATFFSKFIFTLSFIIPVLLFELRTAVLLNLLWGLVVMTVLSIFIALERNEPPVHVVIEHLGIMILVVILTNYAGSLISRIFG
ncbi:MAG: hypothetical protein GOU99_03575 [Candidatus Altiarchaeota archaeon]|nr:hypothetical protein [Candidatus Altiarchaeota archaeon]